VLAGVLAVVGQLLIRAIRLHLLVRRHLGRHQNFLLLLVGPSISVEDVVLEEEDGIEDHGDDREQELDDVEPSVAIPEERFA